MKADGWYPVAADAPAASMPSFIDDIMLVEGLGSPELTLVEAVVLAES